MSRRAYFWLFLGTTGSGKTTEATTVIRQYVKKPKYFVAVNSSEQLAEFARVRVVISSADLERNWTARELAEMIRRAGAIHFEVSPGADPKRIKAWMDALGAACMLLGQPGTDRCILLLVIDEASNYLSREVFSRGMRRVVAEGRKFGIDGIFILQQLTGVGGDALDMTVRRMVNVLVVCGMDEPNECARVVATWPELRDPSTLRMPDPERGIPGEYQIRDRLTRRAALIRVDPSTGRRHAVPLLAPTGPPNGRR